ncbi:MULTISPECIES: hypothetical protein [unclassified Pseudoalteromonas]|uniref:hypothetical protein n=1 Tax=unclassified Pseudoalteromonas TaxID=194690 RepID=UPI0030146C6C
MTKLADHITAKLHHEVTQATRDNIDAQQLNRLCQLRAKKDFIGAISSPQGIAFSFVFGTLVARFGKIGALRRLALAKRLILGFP